MAFAIRDIRSQLEFGGARPALFNILITNPINGAGDQATMMALAAKLLVRDMYAELKKLQQGEKWM